MTSMQALIQPVNLSANWKKLQQILTEEKRATPSDSAVVKKKSKNNKRKKRKTAGSTAEMSGTTDAESSWTVVGKTKKADRPPQDADPPAASTSSTAATKAPFDVGKLRLTRALALDCEYVGVGADGKENMLARVSLVNDGGECVYDRHVRPTQRITDYRTAVSGIRRHYSDNAEDFETVRSQVQQIIAGRIVVGHEIIRSDFKVLNVTHERRLCRDSAFYRHFREVTAREHNKARPSLKLLMQVFLGVSIQRGEHDSVSDAKASMALYRAHRRNWDAEVLKTTKRQKKRRGDINGE